MADNYVLYLDECGDQNLSSFDPQFPIFTLCGVVVSEEQDKLLADQINSLKMVQRSNKKELPMATLFRPGTPQS